MFDKVLKSFSRLRSELSYHKALKNHAPNLPKLNAEDREIVRLLQTEGVAVTSLEKLGMESTAALLKASRNWLEEMNASYTPQCINGYVLPQIYTVTDLTDFSAWGTEKRLLNIIENYIGLPVSFHGVHLRRDFPNENQGGTLLWHKDGEDRRIIKIFVYLDDVTDDHGPFEYIRKSVTKSKRLSLQIYYKIWRTGFLGIDNKTMEQMVPRSDWKSCPGKTGTVVIGASQDIYHHGTTRKYERPSLFYVYTANPPKRPDLCLQYNDDTFARPKSLDLFTKLNNICME